MLTVERKQCYRERMTKKRPEFIEQVQDRTHRNLNRQHDQAMAERAKALREPGAEVLLNRRCVGKLELDEREATCLVMTWHFPGCEHLPADQFCERCGVGPFFFVAERPHPALCMDCAELVTPSATTVRRLRLVQS